PEAPKVVADENNLQEKQKNGDAQKAEAAFANADAIVEGEYITPRIHHCCLETHGMVVDYRGGDTATIYATTQGTFTIHEDAAKELELPVSAVTTTVEHMGGGFGSKFGLGLEGMLACRLSKQTKAPVKLMFTRYDEFVMAGNRSGSWQKLKAGVKNDGTIVALNARQYRLGGLGPGSQAGQPYIYRMGDTYREIYALHTNEDSSVAMRAPGHPQASFAVESLMDELAYKIKMDPVEFRKKNLRDDVYHRQLDRGAREIGWSRRNPVAGGNAGPLKRGMGNSKRGNANPSGGSTTAPSLSPSVKDAAIKARMLMAERGAPLLGKPKPEEVVFAGGKVSAKGQSISWQQATASLPAAGITSHGEWRADLQARGIHGVCFAEVEVD